MKRKYGRQGPFYSLVIANSVPWSRSARTTRRTSFRIPRPRWSSHRPTAFPSSYSRPCAWGRFARPPWVISSMPMDGCPRPSHLYWWSSSQESQTKSGSQTRCTSIPSLWNSSIDRTVLQTTPNQTVPLVLDPLFVSTHRIISYWKSTIPARNGLPLFTSVEGMA